MALSSAACYLYIFLSFPSPGWKRSPAGWGLQIDLTWALALPFTCHVSCHSNNVFHTNAQAFLKPGIWNTQALLLCVNDGLNTCSGPNFFFFLHCAICRLLRVWILHQSENNRGSQTDYTYTSVKCGVREWGPENSRHSSLQMCCFKYAKSLQM